MTRSDLEHLRDNLLHVKAWIQHWQEDARCHLTPTPSSLESAMFRVTNSLGALDRIKSEQKETV